MMDIEKHANSYNTSERQRYLEQVQAALTFLTPVDGIIRVLIAENNARAKEIEALRADLRLTKQRLQLEA